MADLNLTEPLRAILESVNADSPGEPVLDPLRGWESFRWRQALLQLPTDAQSFLNRYERHWDLVIADLARWCADFRSRPPAERQHLEGVFGYLGLLLVTLVSLRHSDEYRHPREGPDDDGGGPPPVRHDCAALCVPMLDEPAVRRALHEVYAPDAWIPDQEIDNSEPDDSTRAEWARIDLASLRFHRHGTTSIILSGLPVDAAHGRRQRLALKCLIYPYLRVPTIARATRSYYHRYGQPSRDLRHLVRVWASSSSWILMDLVPGETLAEHLDRRRTAGNGVGLATAASGGARRRPRPGSAAELRIDLLDELGGELFHTMAELERAGLRHCDLSPSNIMVVTDEEADRRSFVLIDLGANYLYTRAVPGMVGPDAAFVAPEIRAGEPDTASADLYSVGQLLITVAGLSGGPGGAVPDAFYAETPVMARFIEDLVDREPARRLLIFKPNRQDRVYPQLREYFREELAAMAAARAELPAAAGPAWAGTVLSWFTPLSGALGRQRRMWQIRRDQNLYRDQRRGMYVRWLLLWSWVSALAWYVGITVLVTWWLRDLGLDWGNQAIAFLQQIAGTSKDEFPYLDSLRQSDYPIPDLLGNLPVRLAGLSFLLVGARFYQNLLSGITPLVTGPGQGRLSAQALVAEGFMRLFSLTAFVLVMPATLVQRRWWPLLTALGILLTFLCNLSLITFARAALRRARAERLSIVPAGRSAALDSFADWTPSAAFYAVATGTIGTLIYLDLVKDVYVYAGAVTAINIVLFYLIKCSGDSAADVRIGLGRAFLAAERLRYVAEARSAERIRADRSGADRRGRPAGVGGGVLGPQPDPDQVRRDG